jgi:methyl-accepting chemotaxis protein
MRIPQLTVRRKIMGTVFAVATVVLAFGAWAALTAVTSATGRGAVMRPHFIRYKANLADLGSSEYAIVRLISSDPTLVKALEAGDPAQAVEATKRMLEPLESTVAPDLFNISDASGSTIAGPGLKPIPSADFRAMRLFGDLREAKSVRGRIAIIGGKVYRVSGAAVRSGDHVVGTVLVGELLQSWFENIASDSGSDVPAKQHRFVFVSDDKVLASALPKAEWDPFAKALKSETEITEDDAKIPIIADYSGKQWDIWKEEITGYERNGDPENNKIGTLYLVRTRAARAARAQENLSGMKVWFGVALALALLVGYVLAVGITRPLKKYIEVTEDLTRGRADLSKRLHTGARDELGMLARNLNRVFAKIHSLAAGVQRTAFQVNASSGEISSVSKQMYDGAREQAGKISNSTAAVTELSSSIQQVAENAAEATRAAKASGEAVTRAMGRLGQIRSTVEDAAQRISTLGESGKRIGNIVEVIRQISEQTTMLALNAAIEAAHAGEHGRGFAVVADEVSSLAKRTGQSARDIEDLIATIRDQTSEAVRVMQDGSRVVEEGTNLVETTLADLKTLVSVIDDTASAVQEQAIASDEIARNMDAVQRIAGSVLASSENAVAQGDRLQKLADELEESVKGFRIDPERAALDEAELKALPEAST